MADHLKLSEHGKKRMAQRDISQTGVDYVAMHGKWRVKPGRRGDRMEVVLTRAMIPYEDLSEHGYLAGVVLILDDNGKWLITTYKKRALESKLRCPYTRERKPWHACLENSLTS